MFPERFFIALITLRKVDDEVKHMQKICFSHVNINNFRTLIAEDSETSFISIAKRNKSREKFSRRIIIQSQILMFRMMYCDGFWL